MRDVDPFRRRTGDGGIARGRRGGEKSGGSKVWNCGSGGTEGVGYGGLAGHAEKLRKNERRELASKRVAEHTIANWRIILLIVALHNINIKNIVLVLTAGTVDPLQKGHRAYILGVRSAAK